MTKELPPLPKLTPQQRAESRLEALAYLYEEEANPVFVWMAWGIVAEWQMEIPEWITAYLNQSATSLLALVEPDAQKDSNAVAKAFGFQCDQGKSSSFTKADIAFRDGIIAMAGSKRIYEGEKKKHAEEHVSDDFGVSPSTVHRAMEKMADRMKDKK